MFIVFILFAILFLFAFSFLVFLSISYRDRQTSKVYWSLLYTDIGVLSGILSILAKLSSKL